MIHSTKEKIWRFTNFGAPTADDLRRQRICKKRYGRATVTIRRFGPLSERDALVLQLFLYFLQIYLAFFLWLIGPPSQ